MQFEWDERKNKANKNKHGISFELATFVFQDPFQISVPDERFDYHEQRWHGLGLVKGSVIYLAFTVTTEEEHHEQEIIRIVSARAATQSEAKRYYIYREHGKRT